ncbi:MAG: ABC transporter, partial [Bifidobacteriaceae bacterium]|nr:ABC transporter [Bifidobacteriaceae bacterium]
MRRFSARTVAIGLTAAVALTLGACGKADEETGSKTDEGAGATAEVVKLKVGVSPVPHGEILGFVKDNLAEAAGLDIDIVDYQDYILPNTALNEGDLDANYFQHKPYLDSQVEEFGYDFYGFPGIHIEP